MPPIPRQAITVRELLTKKIIDEMAKCAGDPPKAFAVLGHLTSDMSKLPAFGQLAQPYYYWLEVCREISRGALEADLYDLLERFAALFPNNEVFEKYARRKHLILFAAANPDATDSLRLLQELRSIQDLIKGPAGERLLLATEPACDSLRVAAAITELNPTVLHFSGHGTKAGLIFNSAEDLPQLLPAQLFAKLLGGLSQRPDNHLRLVVLNACYSAQVSSELRSHGFFGVGWSHDVPDELAIIFAEHFYSMLIAFPLRTALENARNLIMADSRIMRQITLRSGEPITKEAAVAEIQLVVPDGADAGSFKVFD